MMIDSWVHPFGELIHRFKTIESMIRFFIEALRATAWCDHSILLADLKMIQWFNDPIAQFVCPVDHHRECKSLLVFQH
jgi:hypothetical protein